MADLPASPVTVGPEVGAREITFTLADPDRRLFGVHLEQDIGIAEDATHFRYDDGSRCWHLTIARPAVRRMEYKLRLHHPDGGTETMTDPTNPLVAPGAFGDKSVLELPGYAPPAWLDGEPAWPVSAELATSTAVGPVEVTVLSPAEPSCGSLLLAHDGPEYARLASLGEFAATMVRDSRLPPFHLALAAPGPRDERYSANPAYSTALARSVLPELRAKLDLAGPAVLMGASLGGLAALHTQRRFPRLVSGLFLQSGSFFVPQYDECESDFPFYPRIIRYIAAVLRGQGGDRSVPTVLTCGSAEENLPNNRLMATTLRRQGYPVSLDVVPDAHNYVAWRDAFDPHLVDLLARVWTDA